jgi:Leucine-rich repeat (LRR) protein
MSSSRNKDERATRPPSSSSRRAGAGRATSTSFGGASSSTYGGSRSGGSRTSGGGTSVKFDRLSGSDTDSLYSGIGLTNVDIIGSNNNGKYVNPRDDPLMNTPTKTPSPDDDNFALMGGNFDNLESAKVERKRRQYQASQRRWIIAGAVSVGAAFVAGVGYFGVSYMINNRRSGGGTQSSNSSSGVGVTSGTGTGVLNQPPVDGNGDVVYPDHTPTSTFDAIVFGTDSGVMDSTPRLINMQQAILDAGMSVEADLVRGSGTPQRQALRWMVEMDPSQPEAPLPGVENLADPRSYSPTMPSVLDRYALTVFFFATSGPEWLANRNWLLHRNLCNWQGVYCQQMLDENSVTRTVIASLTLANNKLQSDQLPAELFDRVTMKHLNLLNLHTNEIGGTIPPQVGNLNQLETLALFNNTLGGSLPASVGTITSLTNILLSGNRLIGSLPSQMGALSRLEQLQVYDNSFFGLIPQTLSRCTRLKRMWLSKNRFSGRLPHGLFANMKHLEALYLDENFLSGALGGDTQLGKATKLRDVRAYKNMFTGDLPHIDLTKLTNLELLYLDQNQFAGSIPADFFYALTKLRELSLFKNQLTGSIPDAIGAMSSLEVLDVGENQLQGSLPFSLSNLRELCKLRVYKNNLIGELPNLQNCVKLDDFEVQHNSLGGTVPAYLGTFLPELKFLILSDNQFNGYLPDTLGRLSKLQNFKVDQNNLLGDMPAGLCARNGIKEVVADCDLECKCCTSCVSSDKEVIMEGKNWNL